MNHYSTTITGGSHWSFIARKNIRMKLTDITGGANVGMLFYNPNQLNEKYNAPDTLKCQHTFKLSTGNCLYSDMGRIFCSIIDDSFGWHDTVCGNSNAKQVADQWHARDYQKDSNQWLQNGNDAFLVELAKYDLGRKSMAANLNLFSRVECDDEGNLKLVSSAQAEDSIELRFEMDTLVVLHTCPHPLSAQAVYPHNAVKIDLKKGSPAGEDDLCRNYRPENQRGFQNNDLYHLGL